MQQYFQSSTVSRKKDTHGTGNLEILLHYATIFSRRSAYYKIVLLFRSKFIEFYNESFL